MTNTQTNTTNYARVNGLKTDNENRLIKSTKRSWNPDGDTVNKITTMPSFKKGSMSAQILTYMKSTKSPRSIRNITEQIMRKREYTSYNSAVRSISQEVLRLANWGVLNVAGTRRDNDLGKPSTIFTLNEDLR